MKQNKNMCFYYKAPDNTMYPIIKKGDIVFIDPKIEPTKNDIILVAFNRQNATIKKLKELNDMRCILADNENIKLNSNNELHILGKITKIVKNVE